MDSQINGYKNTGLKNYQTSLFDLYEYNSKSEIVSPPAKKQKSNHNQINNNYFNLNNRRYIGNKYSLINWIFSIINNECHNSDSFADIFAGTGVISAVAKNRFKNVIVNDFLYSNYAIYKAFFGNESWDKKKVENILKNYNDIDANNLEENYFSINFGGKYFSKDSSKKIGFIREDIENNKINLTEKEYYILIASLIYSIDKVANTVGHYETYFKKDDFEDGFYLKPIKPIETNNVTIYREDSNKLAKDILADVVYIDPPYNSRQYSRFYHVLETLTKWDKPKLYGTALKPKEENMSDYCRNKAKSKFAELVKDLKAKYLVVSYNNTYNSKSNSSRNKMTLEEIEYVLKSKGKTKIFERDYKHFNAGNTDFKNHKEYLFVTEVKHE